MAEPERLGSGGTAGTPSKPASQALASARSPAGPGHVLAHVQTPHRLGQGQGAGERP